MTTVLAVGRFLGTLFLVLGLPFLFLVYVIGVVESTHPRTAWLDGYRYVPPRVSGQSVTLVQFNGELADPLADPYLFAVDTATDASAL